MKTAIAIRINKMMPPRTPPTMGPTLFEERTDPPDAPSGNPVPFTGCPEDEEEEENGADDEPTTCVPSVGRTSEDCELGEELDT